jgi:hypothetical protein
MLPGHGGDPGTSVAAPPRQGLLAEKTRLRPEQTRDRGARSLPREAVAVVAMRHGDGEDDPPAKESAKTARAKKAASAKTAPPSADATTKPRVFGMSFASVYPLYVKKAENKGRTAAEVDEVIAWLTGYRGKSLQRAIETKIDFETFFAKAPRMHPNAERIKGLVCGVRVEDVADPVMQKIRYLDKLVDELARGKKMESILRA